MRSVSHGYQTALPSTSPICSLIMFCAVLFGAADTVEKLGFEGKKVFVVTENREFASWMEPCHRDVMMNRFAGGKWRRT